MSIPIRLPECFAIYDFVGRPVSAFLNDQIDQETCIEQLNNGVKDILKKGGWLKSGKKYTDIDEYLHAGYTG